MRQHPPQLLGRAGTAWPARACCRSGRARLFSRAIAQVERGRHPAAARRRSARSARRAAGEQQRQPQPAVGGEALLRREVVDVDLGRGPRQPAGADVASTSDEARRRRRPAQVHHHAGRGLVVGEGVDVDAGVGDRRRVGAGLGAATIVGRVEVGRPAPRRRRTSTRTRRTRGAGCVGSISPNVATSQNTVDAAVAEHDLPAVGQGEQRRAARRGPRRRRRFTGAWRWEVPSQSRPAAASASTASGRTLDGPQPKRPSRRQQRRRGS